MAANETNAILEILNTLDIDKLILAFCLSMFVGLLIGVLVFVLLTWMSRRHRASVSITRRPGKRRRGAGASHRFLQRLYSDGGPGRPVLNLHRLASADPADALGRSPSFLASTFRPVGKSGEPTRGAEDDHQAACPHAGGNSPDAVSSSQSFCLGKGSLRGFLPTQTPPPAYDSVIRAFQERRT